MIEKQDHFGRIWVVQDLRLIETVENLHLLRGFSKNQLNTVLFCVRQVGCYYLILQMGQVRDLMSLAQRHENQMVEPWFKPGLSASKLSTLSLSPAVPPFWSPAECVFSYWHSQPLLPEDQSSWCLHMDKTPDDRPTHLFSFLVNYHNFPLTPSHHTHTHTPTAKRLRSATSTSYASSQIKPQTKINCYLFFKSTIS